MDRQQFVFSAITGISIAAAGAMLAVAGTFDWSLFWVGGGITALTFATFAVEQTSGKRQVQPIRIRSNNDNTA